jgi:hypothetical protein
MKAPNGETLIARDEQQKQIMEKAGFVEVKPGRKPNNE